MGRERVRIRADHGQWEWLGVDRYPGIVPEGLAYTFNKWGPDGCTFTLRRDPNIDAPDLTQFNDLEVVVGERVAWSGSLIETPGAGGDDPVVTVQALGAQYELDDEQRASMFVLETFDGWIDLRSHLDVPMTGLSALYNVEASPAGITITAPTGTSRSAAPAGIGSTSGGVLLDLGPNAGARRVVVDYANSANASSGSALFVVGSDQPYWAHGAALDRHDFIAALTQTAAGASGTNRGTAATDPRRYITILHNTVAAAGLTWGADVWWTVKRVQIFAETAYENGAGRSALTVGEVVKAALKRAPSLDQDTTGIAATALTLNHFGHPGERRTARELLELGNAFHAYRLEVGPDRRLRFRPQAAAAGLRVNTGKPGARFADASANSGREQFNRLIARGRGGDGRPLETVRGTYSLRDRDGVPQPPSSAASTGWTIAAGNATWLTMDGKPGMALHRTTVNPTVTAPLAGTLRAGVRYRVRFWHRWNGAYHAAGGRAFMFIDFNAAVAVLGRQGALSHGPIVNTAGPLEVWRFYEIDFMLAADLANPTLRIGCLTTTPNTLAVTGIADLELTQPRATPLDRRGRARDKLYDVQFPVDPVALDALADAYIAVISRPALRGTLEVSADDVVETASGAPVTMDSLGHYIGEIVLIENLIDPDSGDVGRLGVLAGVNRSEDSASIAIDNDRASFEALLARMGRFG